MQAISENDIKARIARDNPWWGNEGYISSEANSYKRVYFEPFKRLALNFDVKRATILLGPRRVGKTFMIKQIIAEAIAAGVSRNCILYVSIDTPIYSGISLEKFVKLMPLGDNEKKVIIFDEIQYLKDWEVHLKDLVDAYPGIKFIASGSAAAALQLKSKESGAGRFSDFMLPPLTFFEFLSFLDEAEEYIHKKPKTDGHEKNEYIITNIGGLNRRFI